MLGYLILLFTVLPALELALLIKIGTLIGVFDTMMIIIATGVSGAFLARYQGFVTINKIQNQLNRGQMPTTEMMDGLMILVGGVVLLTPGLITDSFGLLLLIPFTRSLIKKWVSKIISQKIERGEIVTITPFQDKNSRFDDIDI